MRPTSTRVLPSTHLQKGWRLPALLIWLAASLIALILFFAGLPARAAEIQGWYRGSAQVFLAQNQNGEIVLSPGANSTAARAGVMEGDILLSAREVPVTSVAQAEGLLAGPIGTTVTVSVRTGNFPPRQLVITRDSVAGGILLRYGLSSQFALVFVLSSEILFALLCAGMAALLVWHRSDDWMAVLASIIILMVLVGLSLPVISLGGTLTSPQSQFWIDVWYALAFGLLILFFYLFPEGRFGSRLTLALAIILGIWLVLGLFNRTLLPWHQPATSYSLLVAGWALTGFMALALRYRSSAPFQRRQIRWIVWAGGASTIGLMMQIIPLNFDLFGSGRVLYDFALYPLGQLFKASLPASILMAIVLYRLWNIELIFNRVLVYGSLTVLTMLGYLGTVFVLQAVFTGLSNPIISFFATGFVAVLFEPLRRRLQRLINHWMYGDRDDPYAVLTRLAGTLETTPGIQELIPTVARTIQQALKVPYVGVLLELNGQERAAAAVGAETDSLLSFPLIYQGESIGRLQLAPRAPNEAFSEADLHLIGNIARQAGAVAETVRLNAELLRSRAQVVTEREEERLRIRRDLHDELGPQLASQGLKLAAARQMIRPKPDRAEELVDEVMQQSQQTVSDVRRLVHGLRPPVLDQLGLLDAVRDLARSEAGAIAVEVSALGGSLPELPAAVEVNAYRIVLEALHNAARHSQASQCAVTFQLETGALIIQIADNGIGMPAEYRAGVGMRSMRLRAEEIGGQFRIEAVQSHGTRITARLPLIQ